MEITDIYNKKTEVDCLGCAIEKGDFIPPGGLISKTDYFCVNQDCEIPIPGFIIISSNRHIQSIDELTDEEKEDFIGLATKLKGMREVLNIDQINMIMVENGEHHFHVWLLPVSEEMLKKFGFGTKAIKPTMNYAKKNFKTPENYKKVEEDVEKLRQYMKRS